MTPAADACSAAQRIPKKMEKRGKYDEKINSPFLLLVMIAAMVSPSIAATREPEVSPQACSHDYRMVDEIIVKRYYNNQYHRDAKIRTYVCNLCGAADQVELAISGTDELHSDGVYVSASCNGTTQTHTKRCPKCNGLYTVTVRCPKAPHSGSCTVLPV